MKRFTSVLKSELKKRGIKFSNFYDPKNIVEKTLLAEYGGVFVAQNGVIPAPKIVFKNNSEVERFQRTLSISKQNIGGFDLELQTAAMNDLMNAAAAAEAENLTINPRSADSARRDYNGTIELWASRVNPALEHWTAQEKLSVEKADQIRSLQAFEQVPEVFALEKKQIFFSKDLSKSVIYSVAPPGTSQHLAMLAFDVAEFRNKRVRQILAAHKWFQTVASDLPHFTYLGIDENDLPEFGLEKVENENQSFWIPNDLS